MKRSLDNGKSTAKGSGIMVGVIFAVILLCLLIGAASIPFFFESTSMWYRFGVAKTLIRTGKVFGMLAASLVLLQPVFSGRISLLEMIYPPKYLATAHRIAGFILVCLALLHPLFIFAPEDITNLPVAWKYWPEVCGGFLLLLLWFIFATAKWKTFLHLPYRNWQFLHRLTTFLAVSLLMLHIFFVSDTFKIAIPRRAVTIAFCSYALLWGWLRIRGLRGKRRQDGNKKSYFG